jgi:hypothetical protein
MISPELPTIIKRNENATVKKDALCRSFQFSETVRTKTREWLGTNAYEHRGRTLTLHLMPMCVAKLPTIRFRLPVICDARRSGSYAGALSMAWVWSTGHEPGSISANVRKMIAPTLPLSDGKIHS